MLLLVNETVKLFLNLQFTQTIMFTIIWILPLPGPLPHWSALQKVSWRLRRCISILRDAHSWHWLYTNLSGIYFTLTAVWGSYFRRNIYWASSMCLTLCLVQRIEKSVRHSCYPYVVYNLALKLVLANLHEKWQQNTWLAFQHWCVIYIQSYSDLRVNIKSFAFFRLRIYNKDARWKLIRQRGKSWNNSGGALPDLTI